EARTRSPRLQPALGAGVRGTAFTRRRAWLARRRGPDEPSARPARRRTGRLVRFLPVLQLPLLPGLSWSARGSEPGGPRADRGARSGDWPRAVSAGVSRRPRGDVQLAGRAG